MAFQSVVWALWPTGKALMSGLDLKPLLPTARVVSDAAAAPGSLAGGNAGSEPLHRNLHFHKRSGSLLHTRALSSSDRESASCPFHPFMGSLLGQVLGRKWETELPEGQG